VTDRWQRRGVASVLFTALIRFARMHGIEELIGSRSWPCVRAWSHSRSKRWHWREREISLREVFSSRLD
jgi:hypothetical protein